MSKRDRARVAVIGGGASGLVCATECARAGLEVMLFEQKDRCGKKILASGNGRCNITNTDLHASSYYGGCETMLKEVLTRFGFVHQKRYFASLGLLLHPMQEGRVYPVSMEAKSVAALLLSAASESGAKIVTDTKVLKVQEDLSLLYGSSKRRFDAVVVATGSLAASHLGGGASGYEIARSFGHAIISPYPALVQLISPMKYPKMMQGVRIDAEAKLLVDGVMRQKQRGDVLFSNYGLSGLAILDLSIEASLALKTKNRVEVAINLLPDWEQSALTKHIVEVAKAHPSFSIETILHSILPIKVVRALLLALGVDRGVRSIGMKLAKRIVYLLQNWHFEISDTKGFEYAEVCGGGVSCDEIDPKTFESKRQEGLYFIGEVLDVVGKRGGYNFAFAWGSGYLCAEAIVKKWGQGKD